jgi:hypothetical protein
MGARMKWPVIAEAWTYRDPQEVADALIGRTARLDRRASRPEPQAAACPDRGQGKAPAINRDRYYRQARRLHVLQAMKGSR